MPSVLVCGGVGFVGRNLVKYLVDNKLADHIRVVDKAMPVTAFLSPEFKAAFEADGVEYMQGDLSREASVKKAFTKEDGSKFTYVINVSEAEYGQDEATYQKKIEEVAKQVGNAALAHGVEKFIEVSHAGVYESKKDPASESTKIKPWTLMFKFKYSAEEALRGLEAKGLPLVVLRPAYIYGQGDVYNINPRLVCARVYKKLDQKMKFLWTKNLRLNTVHASDVCKAIWHGCTTLEKGAVFNLADESQTTQGTLNVFLEEMFGISTGFQGDMVSNLAKMAMKSAAEEINDKHMTPWSELCQASEILNTPLTPYLDVELLYQNHMSVDGSAIKATGFEYDKPQVTIELLQEQLQMWTSMKLFPE